MICGLDEAGCGPLAGPVTAGAAVLPPDFPVGMLRDSKQLSEKKRLLLYDLICERAAARATAFVWPEEIDRINIRQAALKAMAAAFERVREQLPDVTDWLCLADGNQIPPVPVPCSAVVKGDRLIPEIMAASILAKTERDRYMLRIRFPPAQRLSDERTPRNLPAHRTEPDSPPQLPSPLIIFS